MTLDEKFYEIANSVADYATTRFQQGACPDQCVGRIADFGDDADDFPHREPAVQCKNSRHVVLVLESPHIAEFSNSPGPAQGKTGVHIRKHIADIIVGLNANSSELILINAIQYQCSLGRETHYHRDEVFRRFWKEGGRKDFEERLKQVYHAGDVLLNCCTGSHPTKGLRQLVTTAIQDSLGMVQLHSGPHPYSWISEPHRRSVRLVTVQSSSPDAP